MREIFSASFQETSQEEIALRERLSSREGILGQRQVWPPRILKQIAAQEVIKTGLELELYAQEPPTPVSISIKPSFLVED